MNEKTIDPRSPEEIAAIDDVLFRILRVLDRVEYRHKVADAQGDLPIDRALRTIKENPGAPRWKIAKLAKVGKTTVDTAHHEIRERQRAR